MGILEAAAIFAAGIVAGTINTVVGSGTLFTFPVLLAFGYPPVVANVSNTVGLVPGSAAGAVGYRRELAGQRPRAHAVGRRVGGRRDRRDPAAQPACVGVQGDRAGVHRGRVGADRDPAADLVLAGRPRPRRVPGRAARDAGVFLAGVYGGYFGAAQGIMVLSILALSLDEELQRMNALKVVLAGLVNLVAGIVFVFVAHVAWAPAALIAGGSMIGGLLGARVGRRLPPLVLRAVIVVVGIVAIVHCSRDPRGACGPARGAKPECPPFNR